MTEDYRPVPGFEGYYEASQLGTVRRIKTQGWRVTSRILKPGQARGGYDNYVLCLNNERKNYRGHRLVWETFNGLVDAGKQINHINGDKKDNRLSNLELCTASENMVHAYSVLGRDPRRPQFGTKNGRAKLTNDDVEEIKRLRATGLSQQKIADQFGVDQTNISAILRGATWR